MKVCETCGEEIATIDSENQCLVCEEGQEATPGSRLAKTRAKAKVLRQERDKVMKSIGLVKVRGALGGTYWE